MKFLYLHLLPTMCQFNPNVLGILQFSIHSILPLRPMLHLTQPISQFGSLTQWQSGRLARTAPSAGVALTEWCGRTWDLNPNSSPVKNGGKGRQSFPIGLERYPLVNKHSNGISPFSIGTTSSQGPFSIAMLVYGLCCYTVGRVHYRNGSLAGTCLFPTSFLYWKLGIVQL